MSRRWTDERIAGLPTPKSKKPTSIGEGLYVMVYPTGSRSFATLTINDNGHPQFKPFAKVRTNKEANAGSAMTLEQARLYVLEHRVALATDRHDELERRVKDKRTLTFSDGLEEFLEKKILPRNIGKDRKQRYRHTLTAHLMNRKIPEHTLTWGALKFADFGGGAWSDRYEQTLRQVEQRAALGGDRRGACTLAHQTDQFAQQFFDYCVKREWMRLEHVPERLKHVNKPRAITRALSVAELEHMFAVTTREAVYGNDTINEFDAVCMRLLAITGIRLDSVRLARRSHRNLQARGFWTFPADDLKQTSAQREEPTDHHIPMTPLFLREIERLEAVSADFDWLFPERYAAARSPDEVKPRDESWAKHLLGEHAKLLKNEGARKYTAHAFRRTMSNIMQELGVPDHIIDKCAARVPRGTAKTYLTAEVRDQITNAFEQYHDFLHACMLGKGEDYLEDVRAARTADMRKENAARRKRLGIKPFAA